VDEEIADSVITHIRRKYKKIRTSYADHHSLRLNYVASLQLVEKKGKPDFSLQHQRGQQSIGSEWVSLDNRSLFKGHQSSMKLGKRILIVGEAGTGKSTLCAVIAEDWANGKLFQEFLIVLLLPLNQKDIISVKNLPELIRNVYEFDDDTCSTIGIYLKQNKKDNILIIADGWNELCECQSQENPFVHHLLFGDLLPSSTLTVVVTSRPCSVPQQFNGRLITLQGFNEIAIKSYIQMECSSNQEKLHHIKKQLESNPLLGSMCTVPLNLAMICDFCKSRDDRLPNTLPEMYEKLAWNLVQLKINCTKKHRRALILTSCRDIPKELQHPWSHLCEIVFEKFRASSFQVESAFALSSKIEAFGLLKPVFSGRDEVLFSFLHPAIGHYLAISHLMTQPQSTQLEAIRSMHQVGPMFFRFYLSINKNASHDILREVVQKLSKVHHSCNDLCLLSYESRNETVDKEVVDSLCSPGTTLKLYSHNAYECEAMIHVLEKIQQKCTVEINFQNCKLKLHTSRLASILENPSRFIQVKGLDLSNNNLDDSIVLDFFRRAVFALGSLEKLFLRSCGIRAKGLGVIVDSLNKACCKSLIELDLSFNSLSMDCLECLQQYIASDNMKKMEILILKGSFSESISMRSLKNFATTLSSKCNCLRRLDLSANDLGARNNPDLSAIICLLTTSLGKSFDLRLDNCYMSEVENNFLSIMEESIRNKGTIDHIIAHGVIVGPGRSGKNSLMQRLMGERPPDPNQISPSTGVLENVVKIEVKKLSAVASDNCTLIWQKLEYDEEALELIMTTAKSYSHVNEIPKPISIKYVKLCKRKANSDYDSAILLLQPSESEIKLENATFKEMVPNEPECMNSDDTESSETPNMHVTVYSSSLAPVDILKKAVKLRRMDALREHLESSWSFYLTNTGGQIEFQEHLPLLVCGPSIFFITFPLHHDLDQPYEVKYQYPDGSVKKYPSPSTLIDEILQTLATIYTLDCVSIQISGEEVTLKPTVFLIGTHKDCLKSVDKQQKVMEIDQRLQRCVRQTSLFHQHSLQFASDFDNSRENRLMFTVNNLSVNDDDFQKIRFAVQQTVEEKHCKEFTVQCPSSWLIFSLILREKHKLNRVLKLEDAFKIAQECGISSQDELIAALSFIHSRLGLLRYYNVKELDSLVIVDPQVLFDKITDLIEETFVSKNAHRKEIEEFCEKGIISVVVMKRISERSSENVQLPLTWLTKVLNHLRLAALFKDHDEEKYFFPSALCHASMAQEKSTIHTNPATVLIAFETGFCPRGTAGALIKCLMTNEMKSTKRWELLPSKIFRNQVSFYVEDCGDMTIKVLPTHIEFAVDSVEEITETNSSESEIHEEVYTQIDKCMKIITSLYKKYEFRWTFYCSLAECQPHPHPAIIEWNRQNAPSRLRCKVFNKSGVLPRGYKLWNILRKGIILWLFYLYFTIFTIFCVYNYCR
jgi:GTPase SAR1 family protein